MLAPADILQLACTPDLSEAGCAVACRWLAYQHGHLGTQTYKNLRHIAAEAEIELALRRHLTEQSVPFEILPGRPFGRPEQYDLKLGGHRCILVSNLISHNSQINRYTTDPGLILRISGRFPLDQFSAENNRPDDLILFTFLIGQASSARRDMAMSLASGAPLFLLHMLPENLARPSNWIPLEKLALKSESEKPLTIELGGLDEGRNFVSIRQELPPRQRLELETPFYSLTYLHTLTFPQRRLGLHCKNRAELIIIKPNDWGNILIAGRQILLAGWLTYDELRRKSQRLKAKGLAFSTDQTGKKLLLVPLLELHPLNVLLKMMGQPQTAPGI